MYMILHSPEKSSRATKKNFYDASLSNNLHIGSEK